HDSEQPYSRCLQCAVCALPITADLEWSDRLAWRRPAAWTLCGCWIVCRVHGLRGTAGSIVRGLPVLAAARALPAADAGRVRAGSRRSDRGVLSDELRGARPAHASVR